MQRRAFLMLVAGAAAWPLMAQSRNLMALSPGKLFRAATRRWFGPAVYADRIVKVTVRDQNSQVVRVLDSERDLAAFRDLWAALVEVDDPGSQIPPPERPYNKLNIQFIERRGRTQRAIWFYFSRRLRPATRDLARHLDRAALSDALPRRFRGAVPQRSVTAGLTQSITPISYR
jgi:hypothetical protein